MIGFLMFFIKIFLNIENGNQYKKFITSALSIIDGSKLSLTNVIASILFFIVFVATHNHGHGLDGNKKTSIIELPFYKQSN
jgi:hypothetical protein